MSAQILEVQPHNILCTVRDYNNLTHVQRVLERTDTSCQDVMVMTVRLQQGSSTGYRDIDERELFTTYEQQLFSRLVALAETVGKRMALLVAPATDIFQATVLTALQLSEDDVELIHRLWLDLTPESGQEGAHHCDVVHLALRHLAGDLGDQRMIPWSPPLPHGRRGGQRPSRRASMTTANTRLHAADIRRRSYSMAVLDKRVDGGQDVVTHGAIEGASPWFSGTKRVAQGLLAAWCGS